MWIDKGVIFMNAKMIFYREAYKKAVEYVTKWSTSNHIRLVKRTYDGYPRCLFVEIETSDDKGQKDSVWQLSLVPDVKGSLWVDAAVYDFSKARSRKLRI
jgi:hypothetical protein